LQIEAEIVLNFGDTPTIDAGKFGNGVFLFVGLKNSADIIRDYSIKHKG
jgi:hypothetical protein